MAFASAQRGNLLSRALNSTYIKCKLLLKISLLLACLVITMLGKLFLPRWDWGAEGKWKLFALYASGGRQFRSSIDQGGEHKFAIPEKIFPAFLLHFWLSLDNDEKVALNYRFKVSIPNNKMFFCRNERKASFWSNETLEPVKKKLLKLYWVEQDSRSTHQLKFICRCSNNKLRPHTTREFPQKKTFILHLFPQFFRVVSKILGWFERAII